MTAKWKKLIAILCTGALMFQGTLAAAQSDEPEEAPAEIAQEAADPTEESLQEEDIPQVPEEEPEHEPEEIPEGENAENQGETVTEAAEMPAETAEASAETAEMPAEMAEASAEEAAAETAETPVAEDAEAAEIPAETEEATPENTAEAEDAAEAETEAPAEASAEETAPAEESEAEEDVAEAAAAGTSDTAREEATAEAAETSAAEETEVAGVSAETETNEADEETSGEASAETETEESDSDEVDVTETYEENEEDDAEEAKELSEAAEPDETQVGEGTVQCAVTAEQPFILRFVPEKTEELQIRLKADSAFRLSMREESSDLTSDTESNEDHEILLNRNVRQGTALLLELNTDLSTNITIIFAAEDENAADESEPEKEPEEEAEELSAEETEEPAGDAVEPETDDGELKADAEETEADPEEAEADDGEAEADAGEPEAVTEVIITKAVKTGETWEGAVKYQKPALLKLDIEQPGIVYVVIESTQSLRAAAGKTDRPEEEPITACSDPETGILILCLNAEQGSYLIETASEASDGYALVNARFLDEEGYAAWQPQEETREEQETAAETEIPGETPEMTLPEDRSVYIDLVWDTENPQIGDTGHFVSTLSGYENVPYTLQWQTSWDQETWTDYASATQPQLDVVLMEELEGVFFRLVIYVESEQPKA